MTAPVNYVAIFLYFLFSVFHSLSLLNSYFLHLYLGMRFPSTQMTTPSCSAAASKMDLVGPSSYYKSPSAYFRSPATSQPVTTSANIHSFPTPPPTMTYYDSKSSSAAASVLQVRSAMQVTCSILFSDLPTSVN